MKPLNKEHHVMGKIMEELDIVIVKVNGQDLSNATHEETVNSLNTAKEPITVEVLRRPNINSSFSIPKAVPPHSSTATVATQTECWNSIYCDGMFVVPAPPPLYSSTENVGELVSSSSELELLAEDLDYDVEYYEVTLNRATCADRIGLTLCYGETGRDGVSDVFVGEIEADSIAGKCGKIQGGDQIIKINNNEVRSREEAIKLFSENRADISLLICRPVNLEQVDDGFLEECGCYKADSFHNSMCTHDINMMPLIEEERSEFEDESTLTDTATLPSHTEKEAKDSGVGQDSAGSSEQECDSSHYDTLNTTNDVELTKEILPDCSNFRQQLESRCAGLTPEANNHLTHGHKLDINNRVVPKMGTKIMQHDPSRLELTENPDTAYNTAESLPTTLELTKNVGLSTLSLSDKRKQRRSSIEKKKSRRSENTISNASISSSHSDIVYTTEDKLAETIAQQQKVLLEQAKSSTLNLQSNTTQDNGNTSESSHMEWVVKKRSDGTRYITRRPIRTKILSERKKKLENERCGMTTDDDAMSEIKIGKHWSKEERRRHLQKSREHQQRKMSMQHQIEMIRKAAKEGQANLIELSNKKLLKHTIKDMDFVTVQELLAHQGKIPLPSRNLLSVTTV